METIKELLANKKGLEKRLEELNEDIGLLEKLKGFSNIIVKSKKKLTKLLKSSNLLLCFMN